MCLIFGFLLVAGFQERQGLWVFCHHDITNMLGKTLDEDATVETFVDDVVEEYHHLAHLVGES